jgi:23S rRNA (pseudouridine1915-N3)-methyltransferase
MRVVIAAVGRLKAGPERELVERYRDRAAKTGRALGISGIEIVEVRESRARAASRRVIEESIALASIIPDGAVIAVLDAGGTQLTSDSFAAQLRAWREDARRPLCFAIGGADGVGEALHRRADLVLAFGAATWPHQLVRIMLMEQIYRALTILSGHPYHRD